MKQQCENSVGRPLVMPDLPFKDDDQCLFNSFCQVTRLKCESNVS